MKKILIAGGGYADVPLIQSAQKLGYYVITSGNRPDDIGHRYADEVQLADFSDYSAMLELAERLNIDAICPCCNDFSLLTCTYVAEHLGLPGYDSMQNALILHHKDRFRRFAADAGILGPRACSFDDLEDAFASLHDFTFPIIIKPVDLTGGKGISVAHDLSQAKLSIANAFSRSKEKRIVVEEFLSGSRHGYSAMIQNQKVVFDFFDNEYYYINQYLVSGAIYPGIIGENIKTDLRNTAQRIAYMLNLSDGIFHVQYIINKEKVYIIEICRRPPGDLYIKFVQHATGVDYPKWIVSSYAGLKTSRFSLQKHNGYFMRHCIMAEKSGILDEIVYNKSIVNNIFDEFVWWHSGQHIIDHLTEKFGIVFLQFDSEQEMCEKANVMHKLIRAQVH